jgi:hypothetical protein
MRPYAASGGRLMEMIRSFTQMKKLDIFRK